MLTQGANRLLDPARPDVQRLFSIPPYSCTVFIAARQFRELLGSQHAFLVSSILTGCKDEPRHCSFLGDIRVVRCDPGESLGILRTSQFRPCLPSVRIKSDPF